MHFKLALKEITAPKRKHKIWGKKKKKLTVMRTMKPTEVQRET